MFLYLQRELYSQLIHYSLPFSIFDYETSMNTSLVAKKVRALREELGNVEVTELVASVEKILKKLEKLEIVIETETDYAFHRENLFVKVYLDRLQYPYRVGKKLELVEPLGPRPKRISADSPTLKPTLSLEDNLLRPQQTPL